MEFAFAGCENMQLTATEAPNLSGVTNMTGMFFGCRAFNQDLSNWNVSNVTDMREMFYVCTAFNGDISGWDVSNVTDMQSMFYVCTAFNGDISGWDVSNVTDMQTMFYGCSAFNQPLNNWGTKVSNVTYMGWMFDGCTAFNQDLSNWNITSVVHNYYNPSLKGMFNNSGMDCTNYGNTLIGWANNTETPYNITLGASGVKYSSAAQAAHDKLINEKSWTINDAGVDAACGGAVSVTGVSVNPTTATIEAGNTRQLTATVAPTNATNKNLTWSSSDNNIATVSPTGLVTAVAAGNATITVTTLDGGFTAALLP